ncbi:hypothetical protein Y032_0406g904 [Ancylostoma ceylanicum]|nr:hypothetical protein Y032_0406g904 [Ancylostoma ceylanicum]
MTAETKEEGIKQYQEAKKISNALSMNMREFTTNSEGVRAKIAKVDRCSEAVAKVLGIQWRTDEDKLVIQCVAQPSAKITKRTVLHTNASVFDPLGWLTPLMLRNKCFFQSLWIKSYDWDEILTEEDQEQWKKLCDSINNFRMEMPRGVANKRGVHQLITFSDASTSAMAACLYVKQGNHQELLVAKSKLPSIKGVHTIPKLEMNALTIAGRLTLTTYEELKKIISVSTVYLLSDSEIVLNWLKNDDPTKVTGVLVSNRVKEIKRIAAKFKEEGVKVYIGYISTKHNPADCATRGLTAKELYDHIWWRGPEFLSKDQKDWPEETRLFEIPAESAEVLQISVQKEETPVINVGRFSSMLKLKKTVAYMMKFLRRVTRNLPDVAKERIRKTFGIGAESEQTRPLEAVDMRQAEKVIVKVHQKQYYSIITANTQRKLNITLDSDGIWRCHGRLGKSRLPEEAKKPVFIAPNSDLANLIIQEAHGKYHRSTAHTMAEVRKRFWIPKLRQQVKKVIRTCTACQRYNNLPFRYPPLAELPKRRVVQSRPFQDVGLDLFGPLKTRNAEGIQAKAYGCIFTCATTRLMHVELITDDTTTSFINAMRRFMSRREVPKTITCDNAPTFLLAERILTDSLVEAQADGQIGDFLTNAGIKWQKITPYAPWQGGFYERLIKDVKWALNKSLGRRVLDEDSLRTVLVEIESCLNCRPLSYQEEDPDELVSIRPIDFLQNRIVISYTVDESQDDVEDPNFLPATERAQLRTHREAEQALRASYDITEKFWKVWNEAYLTSLREHHKKYLQQGRSSPKKPRLGQVVLVEDPLLPQNGWRLGRISSLEKSNDGEIRQVELRMSNGRTTRRPVNTLIPLELGEECEEEVSRSQSRAAEETSEDRAAEETPDDRAAKEIPEDRAAGETPGQNRRPRRITKKNYPYSEEE